jgi:hypothetical protein
MIHNIVPTYTKRSDARRNPRKFDNDVKNNDVKNNVEKFSGNDAEKSKDPICNSQRKLE